MGSRGRDRSNADRGIKPAGSLIAIEVNGERVVIDSRAMTMRERSVLRAELAKLPVEADNMDWTVGAVWIAMRRTDPDLTFDEVLDSVTVGDIADRELVDAEADSPEA